MRALLLAALLAAIAAGAFATAASGSAEAMAQAAAKFLATLGREQRARASFAFGDEERLDWHYVPRSRAGVSLGELTPLQRRHADALLQTGLGPAGLARVQAILTLEEVLREEEGPHRDPGRYYVSVFGEPKSEAPWGWRVEGHHLSLNYTLVRAATSTSPAFFGANPAEVRRGPRKGLRPLAREEDDARALLHALDPAQRRRAVFDAVAPREIVTGARRKVDPLAPSGIPAAALGASQRSLLQALLDVYLSRMPADLSSERGRKLRETGLDAVHFAWAGGSERGQPHYYRLQGPTFLVEYDNTQDGANHVHTVWRDFDGDFGEDLLAAHYRRSPHLSAGPSGSRRSAPPR